MLIHLLMDLISLALCSSLAASFNPPKLENLTMDLPLMWRSSFEMSILLAFRVTASSRLTPTKYTGYKNFTSTSLLLMTKLLTFYS